MVSNRPRTVYGVRRWLFGRRRKTGGFRFQSWVTPEALTLFQEGELNHTDIYEDEYANESAEKWGTRVYMGMHMARTAWWYAKMAGIDETLDPAVSGRIDLGLNLLTQGMGLMATTTFAYTSAGSGNIMGLAMAASSIPIQIQMVADTINEWSTNEDLRLYYEKRLSRIASYTH